MSRAPEERPVPALSRRAGEGNELRETENSVPRTAAEGINLTSREVRVLRSRDGHTESVTDRVAEETPVSLVYHGVPQVVMMATPADIEDLAVGFTVTENIATRDEIRSVQTKSVDDGIQCDLIIAPERFAALLQRQRNLTGRTGCGVCGVETIEQVIRKPDQVRSGVQVTSNELHSALRSLADRQALNRIVGSVHGAAWAQFGKGIETEREDVGRHNALDKVVGALLRANLDPSSGWMLITSRASYEMVLKSATVGVSLLVAVSAPTALAIDLARECGMTLVGFARDVSNAQVQHVIYTHPERVRA